MEGVAKSRRGCCYPTVKMNLTSRNQLCLSPQQCQNHGYMCSAAREMRYIVIMQNVNCGEEYVYISNWTEKSVNFDIGACLTSKNDKFHATLLLCEPLVVGTGFVVVSSTAVSSSRRSAAGIEDLFDRMYLEPRTIQSLRFSVNRSTYNKVSVLWTEERRRNGADKYLVSLEKLGNQRNSKKTSSKFAYFYVSGQNSGLELPVTLTAGAEYRVGVKALKENSSNGVLMTIAEGQDEFRAELTMNDLRELYGKAVIFACTNDTGNPVVSSSVCNWLYRNRWIEYFYDIFTKRCGVMEVYDKDNSGDPASPINGKIQGVFFMAKNVNGAPPRDSPFGEFRVQVPPQVLFGRTPNLYFSDFYCMRSKIHYVTLVMTKRDSAADRFCRDRLLPVNIDRNPFIYRSHGQFYTANRKKLCIELLYTENIDLLNLEGAEFSHVSIAQGCKGRSTTGGVRKNPNCDKCHVRSYAVPSADF